jgi:diguanylate cyclase (GGDEF)-like protein
MLTGLFNRRHGMETFEHELARSARQSSSVGLLMIDVDFFKRVNDRYGYACGDSVLVEVSDRLRLGVRVWDTVARIGGEEFCVIAPDIQSEDDLADLGERLRMAVCDSAVALPTGVGVPVTVSVGALLVHSGQGSAEHLFDWADRALYAAKHQGRNCLVRFSDLGQDNLGADQPDSLHLAEALAQLADMREGADEAHSRQVATLAAAVVRKLGLPAAEVRYDGAGYPDGLAGERIPLEARIVAVADAFSAMASARPYHIQRSVPDTVDELLRCASTQFDPQVVAALVDQLGPDAGRASVEELAPGTSKRPHPHPSVV